MNKKSPANFGLSDFAGAGNVAAGSILGGLGGRRNNKRRGKVKKRVDKLENQVESLLSKQNQGPTAVETPIEIQPETQMGTVPQAFDGGQEEEPELLNAQPNEQTIASPFTPGAQQAAGGMFGNPMQGSFDRSMDQEEEIY
jgi:hypothetical protein|tara:strand:- start:1129 stop:1551 length:423 start_codon:yes stop_codon:yes gene_type:complete